MMTADIRGRTVRRTAVKGRTRRLSVQTIRKISDYFGVPESYFLEETEAEDLQEALFRKRKLLFDKSGKASLEDLDKILKIVDALVGDD